MQFTIAKLLIAVTFAAFFCSICGHCYGWLEMAFATPGLVLICVVFYFCHQKKWLIASVICVTYFIAWASTIKFGEPMIERQLEMWLDENYSPVDMDIYEISSPCPFIIKGKYAGGVSTFTFHGTVYYLQALHYTCEFHRDE